MNIGWLFKLILFGAGILISTVIYPLFSTFIINGFSNTVTDIVRMMFLLTIIGITLIIPYIKMSGIGMILGLFLNYFYLKGGVI